MAGGGRLVFDQERVREEVRERLLNPRLDGGAVGLGPLARARRYEDGFRLAVELPPPPLLGQLLFGEACRPPLLQRDREGAAAELLRDV